MLKLMLVHMHSLVHALQYFVNGKSHGTKNSFIHEFIAGKKQGHKIACLCSFVKQEFT